MAKELRATLAQCTEELEKSQKSPVTELNFDTFFDYTPYIPIAQQPIPESILPHSNDCDWKIGKKLTDLCASPYYLSSHEVVWSPSGIALGLVIKPTFQYNPKHKGGTWTNLLDSSNANQPLDLFFLVGNSWNYLGTYDRTKGTMVLSSELLKQKLDFASRNTTLFSDLVPPYRTRMIEKMYVNGVLQLQCFGIRCIGFNSELSSELLKNTPKRCQGIPLLPGCLEGKETTQNMKRKVEVKDRPRKRRRLVRNESLAIHRDLVDLVCADHFITILYYVSAYRDTFASYNEPPPHSTSLSYHLTLLQRARRKQSQ